MKKSLPVFPALLLLVLVIALPCFWARGDTLDYWHVYRNNKIILQLDQNSRQKVWKQGPGSGRPDDVYTLRYFRDTPCETCWFDVEAQKGRRTFRFSAKGTWAPHVLDLKAIWREARKHPGKWSFWYVDREKKSRVFLFDLVME